MAKKKKNKKEKTENEPEPEPVTKKNRFEGMVACPSCGAKLYHGKKEELIFVRCKNCGFMARD